MSSDSSTQSADAQSTPAPSLTQPKQLIIVNTPGSGVSSTELSVMIRAIATLLSEVCKLWNRSANLKLFLWDQMMEFGESVDDGAMYYFLIDDHQNIQTSLKSHSEVLSKQSKPTSFSTKMTSVVLTKYIFTALGTSIDPDGKRPSVAATLFKTIAESLINPVNNLWWQDLACGEFVAAKICDPVEGIPVIVTLTITIKKDPENDSKSEDGEEIPPLEPAELEKINVALCNFVLPAWSDATSTGPRFDFMNVLKSPFEVAPGGCLYKHEPSIATPRLNFDRRVPVWRRKSREVQIILDNDGMQNL